MERPAQTVEDRLRIVTVTPVIPFPPTKENVVHKTEKQPCKVEPEWTPVIVDYTKLHKHYLKLSKIKLTCMYIRFISIW